MVCVHVCVCVRAGYEVGQEARYFADQTGVFEIAFFRKNLVMRQVSVCVCVHV